VKQKQIEEDNSIQENLQDLTNRELTALLKERGLNASRAAKPELIKRLEESSNKNTEKKKVKVLHVPKIALKEESEEEESEEEESEEESNEEVVVSAKSEKSKMCSAIHKGTDNNLVAKVIFSLIPVCDRSSYLLITRLRNQALKALVN